MKHTIDEWILQVRFDYNQNKITKETYDYAMKIIKNWGEVYEVYKSQGRIK